MIILFINSDKPSYDGYALTFIFQLKKARYQICQVFMILV